MVLMAIVETIISVCMSSTLLLISKILLHEPHSNNDGSSNFGQMTMMLCFSSIFFANSIQCGFAVYKLHADEICKKQFLHFFKHQLMQKIGPPNCVQNKKRRLLNETEGFRGKWCRSLFNHDHTKQNIFDNYFNNPPIFNDLHFQWTFAVTRAMFLTELLLAAIRNNPNPARTAEENRELMELWNFCLHWVYSVLVTVYTKSCPCTKWVNLLHTQH